jgi:hypothetical protein
MLLLYFGVQYTLVNYFDIRKTTFTMCLDKPIDYE